VQLWQRWLKWCSTVLDFKRFEKRRKKKNQMTYMARIPPQQLPQKRENRARSGGSDEKTNSRRGVSFVFLFFFLSGKT
jgi:hypothetical protein